MSDKARWDRLCVVCEERTAVYSTFRTGYPAPSVCWGCRWENDSSAFFRLNHQALCAWAEGTGKTEQRLMRETREAYRLPVRCLQKVGGPLDRVPGE